MIKKGFTLIELLVVIAIIAILAAVIAPNAFKAIEKSKVSSAESDYKAIKTATLSYYSDTGAWLSTTSDGKGGSDKGTASFISDSTTATPGWNGPYLEKWPTKNPWGGTYTFNKATGTIFGSSSEERYITLTSVPKAAFDKLKTDLGEDVVKNLTGTTTTVYILISRD